MSDLVNPISWVREEQRDCQLTEEMDRKIREANEKMEEVEVHKKVNGDPEYSGPKGPLKPTINGASIKPRLAILRSNLSPRSSPTPGPLLKGGGKKGRGRTRESRGSVRTLEKWLLPLGSLSG